MCGTLKINKKYIKVCFERFIFLFFLNKMFKTSTSSNILFFFFFFTVDYERKDLICLVLRNAGFIEVVKFTLKKSFNWKSIAIVIFFFFFQRFNAGIFFNISIWNSNILTLDHERVDFENIIFTKLLFCSYFLINN